MRDREADVQSKLLPLPSNTLMRASEPYLLTYGHVILYQILLYFDSFQRRETYGIICSCQLVNPDNKVREKNPCGV